MLSLYSYLSIPFNLIPQYRVAFVDINSTSGVNIQVTGKTKNEVKDMLYAVLCEAQPKYTETLNKLFTAGKFLAQPLETIVSKVGEALGLEIRL
jgi:hypothetical protein